MDCWLFASLPSELLLEVFKHAAYSKPCSTNLPLVASWVRQFTEPFLYHTVVLSSTKSLLAFLFALSQKPSSFPQAYVKHLGIFTLGPIQAINQVLQACTSVDNLACSFSLPRFRNWQGLSTIAGLSVDAPHPHEQHLLALSCRDGWDLSLIGPTVTHLRVHISSQEAAFPFALPINQDDGLAVGWDYLCHLSTLTHLAIVIRPTTKQGNSVIFSFLQRINQFRQDTSAPALCLVLVQVVGLPTAQSRDVEHLNALALAAGGASLHIIAEAAPLSAISQWEESVTGGPSIWERPEGVVERRMARRIRT